MDDLKETAEEEVREVAGGRRWYTPFALVGGVALAVWLVAGLITVVALLIWLYG